MTLGPTSPGTEEPLGDPVWSLASGHTGKCPPGGTPQFPLRVHEWVRNVGVMCLSLCGGPWTCVCGEGTCVCVWVGATCLYGHMCLWECRGGWQGDWVSLCESVLRATCLLSAFSVYSPHYLPSLRLPWVFVLSFLLPYTPLASSFLSGLPLPRPRGCHSNNKHYWAANTGLSFVTHGSGKNWELVRRAKGAGSLSKAIAPSSLKKWEKGRDKKSHLGKNGTE